MIRWRAEQPRFQREHPVGCFSKSFRPRSNVSMVGLKARPSLDGLARTQGICPQIPHTIPGN